MDSLINCAQAEFIEERANRDDLVHWIKWSDNEYLLEVRRLKAEVERLNRVISNAVTQPDRAVEILQDELTSRNRPDKA